MTAPAFLISSCLSTLVVAATALLSAQGAEPGSKERPVSFRTQQKDVGATAASAPSRNISGGDALLLEEQKDALHGEVRDLRQQTVTVENTRSGVSAAALVQTRNEASDARDEMVVGDSQIIVPGENLEVFVVEDPSFNGRHQVRRGGYIILPQIGRVAVAGKTIDQAEAAVRRALQSSQLQKASVLIERISGADVETGPTIFLSGEFRTPRPYKIPVGTSPTLISVILSCGGVTDKADLTKVKVMRMAANRGVVEEVNVQKILSGGGLTSDVSLGEGDVVIIPAGASNLIYVTGNVKRQGSYQLVNGERLSAYGAILQSGGFARFANQKRVHVLRALPDGTKAKLAVNVVAISRGEQPDVILQSNDIVVVPEKFFSF